MGKAREFNLSHFNGSWISGIWVSRFCITLSRLAVGCIGRFLAIVIRIIGDWLIRFFQDFYVPIAIRRFFRSVFRNICHASLIGIANRRILIIDPFGYARNRQFTFFEIIPYVFGRVRKPTYPIAVCLTYILSTSKINFLDFFDAVYPLEPKRQFLPAVKIISGRDKPVIIFPLCRDTDE